jgi:hypothetical protein
MSGRELQIVRVGDAEAPTFWTNASFRIPFDLLMKAKWHDGLCPETKAVQVRATRRRSNDVNGLIQLI